MASKIQQYFADKAKTILSYPKTLTKAVYDENGNRLDNVLSNLATNDIFKIVTKNTAISQLAAGATNYNVQLSIPKPDGYTAIFTNVYANAGCSASSAVYSTSGQSVSCVVSNFTTVARTPSVRFYVVFVKDEFYSTVVQSL